MLLAPCLPAAALCITASPTTLYRFFCQVITTSLSHSAYSRLCGKMDYPLISATWRWFHLLILMLFQHTKSNVFSFSKELQRFVPDVLYCRARFIMGGKQTGEHAHTHTHTHTLSSAEDSAKHIVSLCCFCKQVFKDVCKSKRVRAAIFSLASLASEILRYEFIIHFTLST